MKLNTNTDAAVKFTNKLEKLNKFALPVTINQTLNSAAFDVKQRTMLESSQKEFVNRQKNFFKATSWGSAVGSICLVVLIDNNKKKKQQRNIMLSTRIK